MANNHANGKSTPLLPLEILTKQVQNKRYFQIRNHYAKVLQVLILSLENIYQKTIEYINDLSHKKDIQGGCD